MAGVDDTRDVVPLREATRAWFLISLQTFGGPAGQIAVMQRTLVDEKRWIGQQRFLLALDLLHAAARPRGAAAGDVHRLAAQRHPRRADRRHPVRAARASSRCWCCRPSTSRYGDTEIVEAVFLGLAPAVIAIVVQAVSAVGRRALAQPGAGRAGRRRRSWPSRCFAVPFPVVIVVAALVGWLLGRRIPRRADRPKPAAADDGPAPLISDDALHHEAPVGTSLGGRSWRRPGRSGCCPVGLAAVLLRRRQRVRRPGPVLLRRRSGHLRRRVRRPRLRRPAGRQRLRLAGARARWCAGWRWPRRRPGR